MNFLLICTLQNGLAVQNTQIILKILDPISHFPVIENSTDFSLFFFCTWIDKLWVFRFFLSFTHLDLYLIKFLNFHPFSKWLRILIRKYKYNILRTVIATCVVSICCILSHFPVLENSTGLSVFFFYAWIDKLWVFRFSLSFTQLGLFFLPVFKLIVTSREPNKISLKSPNTSEL